MYTVLVVLAVLTAILMCFIVLIQESKGGGLASSFSASNQIMGVRKTTDVIEKTTWALAAILVLLSVASSYVIPAPEGSTSVTDNMQTTVPMNLPGQNTPASTPAAPASAPTAPASTPAAPAPAQ